MIVAIASPPKSPLGLARRLLRGPLATASLSLLTILATNEPVAAQSTEETNTCRSSQDDPCLRTGQCAIQGATWSQEVEVDRRDIFDTQGWPGLCDMVHVALVQGECLPGGQFDVTALLTANTHAWIPEILGPLSCSGDLVPVCDDGFDNDGDGLIDFPDDLECMGADDLSERAQCADHIDNDGDGTTDDPDDTGCFDAGGLREAPQCQDGIDNDGDGRIDFDGGSWVLGAGSPDLSDPDPECAGEAWRNREARRKKSCALGAEAAFVLVLCGLGSSRRRGAA